MAVRAAIPPPMADHSAIIFIDLRVIHARRDSLRCYPLVLMSWASGARQAGYPEVRLFAAVGPHDPGW